MVQYINEVTEAPKAIGPYSQAAAAGNFLFVSGQIPIDPATGKLIEGDVSAQTRQVMQNLEAILAFNKLGFASVVKTTIFLKDLADFQTVNTIYAEKMGDARPARATVQVAALPLGAQVEIEMIASRG